ncbi:MAG: molybdopterin-dependent oxidoreductase, partial [Balneolaceae bacterium]
MGIRQPVFTPHIEKGAGDGFLITDDQAPNTYGCRGLGLEESDESALAERIKAASLVVILNDPLIDRNVLSESSLKDKFVVTFATNHSKTTIESDLVIPITTAAEHAASYVNIDQRIQRTFPAKETKYSNRRLDLEMSEGRLDRYGTSFDNWVTEDNKVDCMPLWTFMTKMSESTGLDLKYDSGREIMKEIAQSNPVFKGVSYQAIDENAGIPLEISKPTVKS